jgi:hypothetical protein
LNRIVIKAFPKAAWAQVVGAPREIRERAPDFAYDGRLSGSIAGPVIKYVTIWQTFALSTIQG